MRWLICLFLSISLSAAPTNAQDSQTPETESRPPQTEPAPPASPDAQSPPPQSPPAASAQQPSDAKKEPVPAHTRTGWATLAKDTAHDFVAFPKRPSTWVILGIGAGAAGLAHLEDDYVMSHATGNEAADNAFALGRWVGSVYVQVGSAVGLWAVGRYVVAPIGGEPRTNKVSEMGFDLIRAQVLSQALTQGMKVSFRRDRPTGECCSFPSGHAAAAFAAASVLERHLGYRASWPAMVGATYVAASRLVDSRHFLSDVLMGAAVGTASGWTVVGRRGPNQFALQPVPVAGGVMVTLTRTND